MCWYCWNEKESGMENNMVKIATWDLGSNSTRLLIADVSGEKFNTLERLHVVTKMEEGLEENGFISE